MGRWRAVPVLLLGLTLVVGVQLAGHVIPAPLFDGMLIVEPYRYLDPPTGGATDPSRVDRARKRPRNNRSLSGSTREVPPQAQVFTTGRRLAFRDSATGYRVTIGPVVPPAVPSDGYLVGNAYAIAIEDDRGRILRPVAGKTVTLALRAPAGVTSAAIAVFQDGAWQRLETFPSGLPDVYLADVRELGTFAIVSNDPDPGCFGYYLPGAFLDGDEPDTTPSASPGPSASTAAGVCPVLMADDPEELFQMNFGETPEPDGPEDPSPHPPGTRPSPSPLGVLPSASTARGSLPVPVRSPPGATPVPAAALPEDDIEMRLWLIFASTALILAGGALVVRSARDGRS